MSLEVSYQGVSLVEEGILKEVIVQLNKDLSLSGIEYEFDINSEKNKFMIEKFNIIIEHTDD